MKKTSKGRRGRPAPRRRVVKPLEVGGLPAVVEPTVVTIMQTCPVHPSVTFRHGGFCEKCYADTAMDRVKKLDDTLAETVVEKFAGLVQQVLASENIDVIERFLGRVMARFDKPKQSQVSATLKAVHLHAPVDFGRK